MRQFKIILGSWNRRDFVVVAVLWAGIGILTVVFHFHYRPVTMRDVGTSIGLGVLILLMMRLAKHARQTRPTPRVKYTVLMSLIDIVNEFTYTGYRVEAMTEDTVVLVRLSSWHFIVAGSLMFPVTWGILLTEVARRLSYLRCCVNTSFSVGGLHVHDRRLWL